MIGLLVWGSSNISWSSRQCQKVSLLSSRLLVIFERTRSSERSSDHVAFAWVDWRIGDYFNIIAAELAFG